MEILLLIWLVFGFAAMAVMQNKGRNGCGGFALGFLLGPFGLIIALVLAADHRQMEKQALDKGEMRKCPQCAELIRREARKCRYCGSDVPPIDFEEPPPPDGPLSGLERAAWEAQLEAERAFKRDRGENS